MPRLLQRLAAQLDLGGLGQRGRPGRPTRDGQGARGASRRSWPSAARPQAATRCSTPILDRLRAAATPHRPAARGAPDRRGPGHRAAGQACSFATRRPEVADAFCAGRLRRRRARIRHAAGGNRRAGDRGAGARYLAEPASAAFSRDGAAARRKETISFALTLRLGWSDQAGGSFSTTNSSALCARSRSQAGPSSSSRADSARAPNRRAVSGADVVVDPREPVPGAVPAGGLAQLPFRPFHQTAGRGGERADDRAGDYPQPGLALQEVEAVQSEAVDVRVRLARAAVLLDELLRLVGNGDHHRRARDPQHLGQGRPEVGHVLERLAAERHVELPVVERQGVHVGGAGGRARRSRWRARRPSRTGRWQRPPPRTAAAPARPYSPRPRRHRRISPEAELCQCAHNRQRASVAREQGG